jgi:hypothetical protein
MNVFFGLISKLLIKFVDFDFNWFNELKNYIVGFALEEKWARERMTFVLIAIYFLLFIINEKLLVDGSYKAVTKEKHSSLLDIPKDKKDEKFLDIQKLRKTYFGIKFWSPVKALNSFNSNINFG